MTKSIDDLRLSTQDKLTALRDTMQREYSRFEPRFDQLCVYTCGSLGRLEMDKKSDLDLFFITMDESEKRTDLDKHLFFAQMYEINQSLGYQPPSKDGKYWDFISKTDLLNIGSQEEDYVNGFTARMLLILESKPVFNNLAYEKLVHEVINKYFADFEDHSGDFHPLFLMNDILRYWYTLTLNYEYRRDPQDGVNKKNWRRLKLKYARLITCFSMIACLYKENPTIDYVIECVKLTPFERLNGLLSYNSDLKQTIDIIEDEYCWFLSLKDEEPDWWNQNGNKDKAISHAERFHQVVIHDLMKFLSESNQALRAKADIY